MTYRKFLVRKFLPHMSFLVTASVIRKLHDMRKDWMDPHGADARKEFRREKRMRYLQHLNELLRRELERTEAEAQQDTAAEDKNYSTYDADFDVYGDDVDLENLFYTV